MGEVFDLDGEEIGSSAGIFIINNELWTQALGTTPKGPSIINESFEQDLKATTTFLMLKYTYVGETICIS